MHSSVFFNLVGQGHIIDILQKAVAASRTQEESQEMTHAWLFTGPPGSGRSSAAVAFAQALMAVVLATTVIQLRPAATLM